MDRGQKGGRVSDEASISRALQGQGMTEIVADYLATLDGLTEAIEQHVRTIASCQGEIMDRLQILESWIGEVGK